MKQIYLMRHSEPLKPININNNDSLQVQNEKWGLTINGEKIAEKKSKINELTDFDIVISSNYVRAISTAKYFVKDKLFIESKEWWKLYNNPFESNSLGNVMNSG